MNIVKNLVLKNFIKIRCSIYFFIKYPIYAGRWDIFRWNQYAYNIHTYSIGLGLKYRHVDFINYSIKLVLDR